MSRAFPWSLLGIAPTGDKKAIRSAYAAKLKGMDPDSDVDGYAHLRHARDEALSRAATQLAPPPANDSSKTALPPSPTGTEVPSPDADDDAEAHSHLQLTAPQIEHAAPHGQVLSTTMRASDETLDRFDSVFAHVPLDKGEGQTLQLDSTQDFTAPLLQGYGAIEAALGLVPGQSAHDRLEAVLGDDCGEPLDEASRTVALRALGTLIEDVRTSTIAHQEQLENYIAGLLASTSPRSDPLLETATAAFRWDEEWHRFNARPAVRFLGARLRGERFRQAVEMPEHRYHKAWSELQRTGPAGLLRWMRASRSDVQFLLSGIRANFPHIEDELDPERVASWERKLSLHKVPKVVWVLLVVFIIRLAYYGYVSLTPTSGPAEQAPIVSTSGPLLQATRDPQADYEAAVADGFAGHHDGAWLEKIDSTFASALKARATAMASRTPDGAQTAHAMANAIRLYTYRKLPVLEGADLDALMQLRLDQLRFASTSSTQDCIQVLKTGQIPASLKVPETLRNRERAIATRLASTPLPVARTAKTPAPEKTIGIPGSLVSQIIARTGLDESTVRKALQNKGSDAQRCTVVIALLQETLAMPKSAERTAILHSF